MAADSLGVQLHALMQLFVRDFLRNRKFRWNSLLHKKPCRAGSRSGGKVDVAYSDPPQAENPAKQDSFLLYRKDRLWRSLELKNARTEAGTTTRRFLD